MGIAPFARLGLATPTAVGTVAPTEAANGPVTADQVIAAFQAAGLEAANPTVMGPKDYGLAPKLCDGRRFLIPSLGPDLGGHVFACKSLADRDRLAKFYQDAGRASAVFFSWVYVKGNIVVQLSGTLNGSTALKYEAAIP